MCARNSWPTSFRASKRPEKVPNQILDDRRGIEDDQCASLSSRKMATADTCTLGALLPFDGAGRLARNIEHDPIHVINLIRDSRADGFQHLVR